MNSYNLDLSLGDDNKTDRLKASAGLYQEGDLLVHLQGCGTAPQRDCEKEMQSYYETWQREVQRLDSKQSA